MKNIGDLFSVYLLEQKKEDAISFYCSLITSTKDTFIYEWFQDDNPFDSSGDIRKTDRKVWDEALKIEDILESFTGERTPSYESGRGWNFEIFEFYFWEQLNDEIYGKYLDDFITENQGKVIEQFRQLDQSTHEDISEFLLFEDVVGDSDCELQCFLGEFIPKLDLDFVEQIAAEKTKIDSE
ncbi:MAG: hypothetical protein AB8B69_11180 [Chitinophagales bacterium]